MTPRPALLLTLLLACTAPPPPDPTPTPTGPPPPPVTVTVHARADGASALDIERSITIPLERALAAVDGLTSLRSASRDQHAELTLTFPPGTDAATVRTAVMTRLQAAHDALPDGVDPSLGPERDPHTAVLYTLQSASAAPEEFSRAADTVRESLLKTPGVVDVALCGRREPRVEISLDPTRLTAHGLATNAVVDALRGELDSLSPGTGIRVAPAVRSPEDLSALVIATREAPIRVADIAAVTVTAAVDTCDAVRLGAGRAIVGVVHARRGAPPDEFNRAVRAALDAQRADLRLRSIDLDVPAHALRLTVDLETPADPSAALATHAERILQTLAAANLKPVAYLQAPVVTTAGEHATGDLFVLPASADEAASLRDALPRLPDLGVGTIGSPADPEDDPQRHRVWVQGPDLDTDVKLAASLADLLRDVSGVLRVHHRHDIDPELELELDRDRLATLGLRAADIVSTLPLVLGQRRVGTIAHGDTTAMVTARLPARDLPERMALLQSLTIQSATGGAAIRLDTLVKIRLTTKPREILRDNNQRAVPVDYFIANPLTRKAAQDRVARDLQLPAGHFLVWD